MKLFLLCYSIAFALLLNLSAKGLSKDSTEDDRTTSLIVGVDYSTNTNTFGRFDNFAKQPSFSPYLSYLSKYGFNLGATGYVIGNSDPSGTETTSELDLLAGYEWVLSPVFSLSPSYTHFFYSSNSGTLKKSYSDYVQLEVSSTVNWWNSSISSKYFWGDFDEIMLTAQTSVNITIDNCLHQGNALVISPGVELNASNINYLRYISDKFKFLRAYATQYPDATVNDLLNDLATSTRPIVSRIAEKLLSEAYLKRRLNTLAVDRNMVISTLFDDKKEMKLSNIGFTLPVYYYFGNFIANGTFAAYKPFNQPKMFGNEWTTYFSLGLSYTFGNHGQNSFK